MFNRLLGRATTPQPSPGASTEPEYEVTAYADDLVVHGRLGVRTARLTDLLATSAAVTLHNVRATVLSSGREVRLPEVEILRDELIAMSMAGPRGNPERRVRRPDLSLLALRAGGFRIWGYAHVPTGVDPVLFVRRHGPVLALTEAIVEYDLAGALVRDDLPGVIVVNERVDLIADADRYSIDEIFESDPPAPPANGGAAPELEPEPDHSTEP